MQPSCCCSWDSINIIYGFGALDNANVFVNDKRFILDNLNTLGWVLIILGVIQLAGGFSLMAGNTFGRVLGIIGGSLGAISALLSIGGAYPWWSLAVFALCVYVVHGIIVFGEDERDLDPGTAGQVADSDRTRPRSAAGRVLGGVRRDTHAAMPEAPLP